MTAPIIVLLPVDALLQGRFALLRSAPGAMELELRGSAHCSVPECSQFDFLPFTSRRPCPKLPFSRPTAIRKEKPIMT